MVLNKAFELLYYIHRNTNKSWAYTDCDYFSIKERIILRNDRFAKDPLLYIQQARTEKTRANMQHQYRSKKEKPQEKIQGSKEEQTSDRMVKRFRAENFYEAQDSVKEKEELEDTANKKRDGKSFKNMTIDEQLIYLTDRSPYAPKLTCEIKTEKRTYRGIVLQYQDEIAKIRSGKRNIEVPNTSIKQIRILGL